jgi:hypothetical protein
MSLSSTDKGLLTPDNCAVIFIDHQPQMFFGVANIDRQDLLNNVLVLAKAAKIFRVPVILTAVESEVFSGNITPQLLDLFPNQTPIERSNLNSWENKELITGREEYRTEQLPDRRTLERNVSGVSGAANVGGRLWHLCRRGRFGRHEQGCARRGDSPHRASWRRLAYSLPGVAGIPTRLVAQGTLRRSDGSREGTLWGVRPGHRICRHDGSKRAGQSEPTKLKY